MKILLITPLVILALLASLYASADVDKEMAAAEAGEYVTAAEEFKKAAEQGDTWAQYFIGIMYYNGRGVIQDYKEAVKWYRLAAAKGNTIAPRLLKRLREALRGGLMQWS